MRTGMESDLAARIARPIWFLVRLLALDAATWKKLLPSPSGASWAPPPGPVGCPPTPHRPGAMTDRDLANQLLDVCEQMWGVGESKDIHWVLSPDGYNRIRKLRDANGHFLMTQVPFREPRLLGWPVKISYDTQVLWALRGRGGRIDEP